MLPGAFALLSRAAAGGGGRGGPRGLTRRLAGGLGGRARTPIERSSGSRTTDRAIARSSDRAPAVFERRQLRQLLQLERDSDRSAVSRGCAHLQQRATAGREQLRLRHRGGPYRLPTPAPRARRTRAEPRRSRAATITAGASTTARVIRPRLRYGSGYPLRVGGCGWNCWFFPCAPRGCRPPVPQRPRQAVRRPSPRRWMARRDLRRRERVGTADDFDASPTYLCCRGVTYTWRSNCRASRPSPGIPIYDGLVIDVGAGCRRRRVLPRNCLRARR